MEFLFVGDPCGVLWLDAAELDAEEAGRGTRAETKVGDGERRWDGGVSRPKVNRSSRRRLEEEEST